MVEEFRTVETDVLVVGTGAAGMRAAVEAERNNAKVVVVDKGIAVNSGATTCAPAPSARAIGGRTIDFKLTLQIGCYLNDQDLLWKACSEAPEVLTELDSWTQDPGIETWNYSINTEVIKHPGITVLDYVMITKLLTHNGRIVGATGLDIVNGEFILFQAKAVVLATGGYAEMYDYAFSVQTHVRTGVTGDGQALAYHAGCTLCEMEMTTFELTGFYDTNKWMNISYVPVRWAMRPRRPYFDKDGNVVLSREDVLLMPMGCAAAEKHPMLHQTPNLVLRMAQEMRKHGPLYVTAEEVGWEEYELSPKAQFVLESKNKLHKNQIFVRPPRYEIREKLVNETLGFPSLMKDEGFRQEISKTRVHLGCRLGQGGPKVNVNGETNVSGLYGAGEGAGSGNLYGAYRPGALIWTTVVQGKWAGENAGKYAKTVKPGNIDLEAVAAERNRIFSFLSPKDHPIAPQEVKKKIRKITGEHLYVIRNEKGLKQAIQELEDLRKNDLPRLQAVDVRRYNNDWVEAIEVQNMLDVGEMMARSALFRTESRGCFNREDYPEMDNEHWLCHTLLKKGEDGQMVLSKGKVVMTKYKPPSVEECLKGADPIPI